ncbi:MAG: glutamate 5-kinase [Pseudomonadales bacterium]|nr:glutamate 5-kinase [Pseudomonadales bacterium]
MFASDLEGETALRAGLRDAGRVVVKFGSALLTSPGTGLEHARIRSLVDDIHELLDAGHQVVVVSSGAVAEGCVRLGLDRRPDAVSDLQAAAAVGQVGLMAIYEQLFVARGRHAAMVLLTHDDFAHRERYLNARATLNRLVSAGVVPVINENDTVATDEIRFGDNDTLAGLVSNVVEADVLVLLTDADGLYTADPRQQQDAPMVNFAAANDRQLDAMAGPGGAFGRGGMVTKLAAARLAADGGAHTLIAPGRLERVISRLLAGERIGTLLAATVAPRDARKRWIAGLRKSKGCLVLDAGAVSALQQGGRSLLCVGVRRVVGQFQRGDVVRFEDENGQAVGQGLVNYTSAEADRLIGVPTAGIASVLGYVNEPELVHRDNLVVYR